MAKKKDPTLTAVPELIGDAHTDDASTIAEAIQKLAAPESLPPSPQRMEKRCKYGLGYKAGGFPKGTSSTRHLFGANFALPASADLTTFIDSIWDQGQTSSCVGNALARAIHVRLGAMGFPGRPRPSRLGVYALAREWDRSGDEALQDQGAMPGSAVQALAKIGIPREDVWPFSEDPTVVNRVLPLDVLQNGIDYELQGYYLIDSDGYQKCVDVRQALAQGFPVALATQVDSAFENYSGGSSPITAPTGYIYGGHYVTLLGYTGNLFRLCNSWGYGWGDRGLAWVDENFIEAASDLVVITTTPKW